MDNDTKTFFAAVGMGTLFGMLPLQASSLDSSWGVVALVVVSALAYWKIRDNERP